MIYLPGVDTWYQTISEPVITTFISMLNAIPPTDPVLVLGITEKPADKLDSSLLGQLFGFSRKNRFAITRPSKVGHAVSPFYVRSLILYSKIAKTSSRM